jgi:hypothetical protein
MFITHFPNEGEGGEQEEEYTDVFLPDQNQIDSAPSILQTMKMSRSEMEQQGELGAGVQ